MIPRLRSRNAYQHVSDFDNRGIVANRDRGLSHRSIVAHFGRDPKTVSKIWNRWVQDCNTKRRAGSQRLSITSSREDKHVTCIALSDLAASS
ncbi:HTH_Tnp_Tc3_2 domain-containing protein [Trichonephila clavipes]|nr:HTH_Tnp_Tc3_2 domain-containing protein [Trichonephila clavipes]